MIGTIYNVTGRILRVVETETSILESQVQEGESLLLAYTDPTKQYIDVATKEVVDIPSKPNEFCEFDWINKEWLDNSDLAIGSVTYKRQLLLQESDWTDTVSAQTRLTNYDEWQFYRQQLRDITTQEGYPFNVEWPTQPV
jgi:hypothetical protein